MDSTFGRMVAWPKRWLASLEATVKAAHIDLDLTDEGLFPEADELHDPEDDPAAGRPDGAPAPA